MVYCRNTIIKNDAIRKRLRQNIFYFVIENEKNASPRELPVFDLGSRVRSGSGLCGGVVVVGYRSPVFRFRMDWCSIACS